MPLEPPPAARRNWFACLVASGVGAFFLLEYAGILPWRPYHPERRRAIFTDPYHWQIAALGAAFLLTGIAFLIPPTWPRLGRLVSLGIIGCLVAGIGGAFLAR